MINLENKKKIPIFFLCTDANKRQLREEGEEEEEKKNNNTNNNATETLNSWKIIDCDFDS